mgnify:CR=1 FL=1
MIKSNYPTNEQLDRIKNWDYNDIEGCLRYIKDLWNTHYGRCGEGNGFFVFATGGWSGNEALLSALEKSLVWSFIYSDTLYLHGGLLIVAINIKAREQLCKLEDKITKWAWKRVRIQRRCK